MANYPDSTYSPRTKENKAGVEYDPSKSTVGYVEDITKLDDEVVAIENDLRDRRDILHVDKENDRVGIGTTSPDYKLDVDGNVNISEGNAFTLDGENVAKIYTSDAGFYGAPYDATAIGMDAGNGQEAETMVGKRAGQGNTGDRSNGLGAWALRYNTGSRSNGFGFQALENNTGYGSNGLGFRALRYNTGNYSNGLGYQALRNNTGANSNGLGHAALQNNTGDRSTGLGFRALQYNTGANTIGLGSYTLRYNDGDQNTALGDEAFNTFHEDTDNAQDIESLDPDNNQVTITDHGFGSTDEYVNLKISTTDTLPSGLTAGIDQWKVIDADTLEVQSDGFSDEGTGTHTLTPQETYTNSTALGYNAEPDASNQVMLGNTNVTQVKSAGSAYFDGSDDNYFAGKLGIGMTEPDTKLDMDGAMTQRPLSADPSDPDAGNSVMWVSDGTGSGDAGDVMMKINVDGTIKTITVVNYSEN